MSDCNHINLHIEGKWLKYMVCGSCGRRWERCVEYSQSRRSTTWRYVGKPKGGV